MNPSKPRRPMTPHGKPLFSGAGAVSVVVVSVDVVFTSVVAGAGAAGVVAASLVAIASLATTPLSVATVFVVAGVAATFFGFALLTGLIHLCGYGWAGERSCSQKSRCPSNAHASSCFRSSSGCAEALDALIHQPWDYVNRVHHEETAATAKKQTPGSTSDPGALRDDCSSAPLDVLQLASPVAAATPEPDPRASVFGQGLD